MWVDLHYSTKMITAPFYTCHIVDYISMLCFCDICL